MQTCLHGDQYMAYYHLLTKPPPKAFRCTAYSPFPTLRFPANHFSLRSLLAALAFGGNSLLVFCSTLTVTGPTFRSRGASSANLTTRFFAGSGASTVSAGGGVGGRTNSVASSSAGSRSGSSSSSSTASSFVANALAGLVGASLFLSCACSANLVVRSCRFRLSSARCLETVSRMFSLTSNNVLFHR